MPSSSRSSWPRDRTWVCCVAGRFFTAEPPGKPIYINMYIYIYMYVKYTYNTHICVYVHVCVYLPHLLYLFIFWWTLRLLPYLGNYAAMNTGVHIFFQVRVFSFSRYIPSSKVVGHMVILLLVSFSFHIPTNICYLWSFWWWPFWPVWRPVL